MRTDLELMQNVLDELEWEPGIEASRISVDVKNGLVTLSGFVNSYGEKVLAERAVKKVNGVRAVLEEIEVKILGLNKRTDQDIAAMALNNLKWNTQVPEDKIKMKIEDGWVTLEGKVEWNYQKEATVNAIRTLAGIRGITNRIQVEVKLEPQSIKGKIKSALERSASLDAEHIHVLVDGRKVILNGAVQSWAEKKQAKEAAWAAPGVTAVEDNIEVKLTKMAY